jgi:hypothetical protein
MFMLFWIYQVMLMTNWPAMPNLIHFMKLDLVIQSMMPSDNIRNLI